MSDDVKIGKYMEAVPGFGGTEEWTILSRRGREELGVIEWHSAWRTHIFAADASAEFSPDCLRDLATFMEKQNRERKSRVSD